MSVTGSVGEGSSVTGFVVVVTIDSGSRDCRRISGLRCGSSSSWTWWRC